MKDLVKRVECEMALLHSFSCAEIKYMLYAHISVTEHEMQLYELSFKKAMNYLTTGNLMLLFSFV